jgi:hypothetical protein
MFHCSVVYRVSYDVKKNRKDDKFKWVIKNYIFAYWSSKINQLYHILLEEIKQDE